MKQDISQAEKAALLERAVINSSVGEISKVYEELGHVEMSAPALGLACRYRGLEMVKALIWKGASFGFPATRRIEETYHCSIGRHCVNYRTNYSLYLLKVFGEDLKGACCLKGMTLDQSAEREAGNPLPFLPDDERVRVLDYLFENKEEIFFQPGEMLFYATYFKDTVIAEELKKLGVQFSGIRINTITDDSRAMDGYWLEYVAMTEQLANEDYLEIMQQIVSETDGKPFRFTDKIHEVTKKRFRDIRVFEFFLAHFRRDKMNRYEIIRGLIDEDVPEVLPIVEREGWLDVPKKRDEMIAYASENGKTESLAWLLDYKNRTADFTAEQEKAEKRLMRELGAAPDSVAVLRKIWSYKKREDGTLMITNYKGKDTGVTVPEKIGKGIVTAVEIGAFGGNAVCVGDFYSVGRLEHIERHREITKITLPETIQYIGGYAFYDMFALEEINIPEGVQEISDHTFYECRSLKNITIPGTVKKIGKWAFKGCRKLEKVRICEGVLEIGEEAFSDCGNLKEVRMPKSVQRLINDDTDRFTFGVFFGCPKLVVYCPEGSKTEAYCKEKGFPFRNRND